MLTWTQELVFAWRPELKFYEQRASLLRMLESAGALQAFRWSDQSIGAQLSEHADLQIQSDSATLRILSPRTVVEEIRQYFFLVLDALKPADVTARVFRAQCIVPIAGPFAATAGTTGKVLIPELPPEGRITDWAMLADGESSSLGTAFQVEYGIIGPGEALPRLARLQSRMADGFRSFDPLDERELPECAFFLDWRWMLNKRLGEDLAASVTDVWDKVLTETWTLSRKVQDRLELTEGTLTEKEA